MITITLHGNPGLRTADMTIIGEQFRLVTWHRQAGGEVHATTDRAELCVVAVSDGRGGVSVGDRWWSVTREAWDGARMAGHALPGVSDDHMAQMFGVERWV